MIQLSKKHIISFLVLLSILVFSCGDSGGGSDPDPNPNPDPEGNLPRKAQAILPANGEPCSEFEEVVGDPTKVLIFFEWSSAQLAQEYEIRIFAGQNQVFNESTASLESSTILDGGKSYTWYIIAKNTEGETQSDTFSFTTPGEPDGNYAPYAAQISLDYNSSTSEMSVSWVGGDEDGDSLTYDVKVWEEGVLIEDFTELTETSLDPITVFPIFEYRVEVISTDSFGDFSVSTVSLVY